MSFNISKINAIGPLKNAIREFKNCHKIQMNQHKKLTKSDIISGRNFANWQLGKFNSHGACSIRPFYKNLFHNGTHNSERRLCDSRSTRFRTNTSWTATSQPNWREIYIFKKISITISVLKNRMKAKIISIRRQKNVVFKIHQIQKV